MTDSSTDFGHSGTASAEMSVPNTSMVAGYGSLSGGGCTVPNNSVCLTAGQMEAWRASASSFGSAGGLSANLQQPLLPSEGRADGSTMLAGSISDEKLSDRLIQIALYQQFEAPPSALPHGDLASARTAFEDIDFTGSGSIPFRHIVRLLRPEDGALALMADPATILDFDGFVQFIEAAAQQRRN